MNKYLYTNLLAMKVFCIFLFLYSFTTKDVKDNKTLEVLKTSSIPVAIDVSDEYIYKYNVIYNDYKLQGKVKKNLKIFWR